MSKVIFDGLNKLIRISDPLVVDIDVKIDLYSAWKNWLLLDSDNMKWESAFRTTGGDPTNIEGTQFSPQYFFLINGWKISIENTKIVNFQLNLYTDSEDGEIYITSESSGVNARTSDAAVIKSELEQQLYYAGKVYFDAVHGQPGTDYPIGTSAIPSNNFADAHVLMHKFHCNEMIIESDLTINESLNDISHTFRGLTGTEIVTFIGEPISFPQIFENLTLVGDINAQAVIVIKNCQVMELHRFQGLFDRCLFAGDIHLLEDSDITVIEGYSIFYGNPLGAIGTWFYLDNESILPSRLNIREFYGTYGIKSMTNPDSTVRIHMNHGRFVVDSSCVEGTIGVRGTNLTNIENNGGPNLIWNLEGNDVEISRRSIELIRAELAKQYLGEVEIGSIDHAIDRIDKNTQN